jgi:uncharacterized small protein (TIGR04563 family)
MSDKVEQALYFPESMLDRISQVAAKLDVSWSWCAQRAWKLSHAPISTFPAPKPGSDERPSSPALDAATVRYRRYFDSPKRKQTLFFPQAMLDEITAEATRLDRSKSWLIQYAWVLAEDEIAQLPPQNRDWRPQ